MKILFSPSESKSLENSCNSLHLETFLFEKLLKKREFAVKKYQDFIDKASKDELKKLFGIKNEKLLETLDGINIFKDKTQKAILRYNGVGYEYLSYPTLKKSEQEFLDNNMIIFSNLFGPILAKSCIPYYKLKQGEKVDDLSFETFYKKEFSSSLDKYLENKLVIDLRATFYEKFYLPNVKYYTFKFLKNSKVVSHWAKAYRGKIARELAIYQPQDEKELMDIEFDNLKIKEIKEIKNKKELTFEIE